jgi:hypothetical protein
MCEYAQQHLCHAAYGQVRCGVRTGMLAAFTGGTVAAAAFLIM